MSEIFTPEEKRAIRQRRRRRKKQRKIIITSIIAILILAVIAIAAIKLRSCAAGNDAPRAEETATEPETEPPVPEDTTATLTFAGDIMMPKKLYTDAQKTDLADHDQTITYTYAGTTMGETDYLVGNLEVTMAGEFSDWPHFSADDDLAVSLKSIGFDMVTTANNHAMDKGFDGLNRTLDVLDRVGIAHTGTYRSQEELDSTHGVLTAEINGLTVTFVDYTYGSNKEWSERPYAINCYNRENQLQGRNDLDTAGIAERMAYARSLDSDLILVLLHWGVEYKTKANEGQEEIADLFLTQGADAIIGGHAHVPQNMEYRTVTDIEGKERTGFVCYSLGNHISDFKDKYTYLTAFLNLHVERKDGATAITSIDYTPLYMWQPAKKPAKRYLVDICAALEDYRNGNTAQLITKKTVSKMEKGLEDLQKIFGEEWTIRPTGRLERVAAESAES